MTGLIEDAVHDEGRLRAYLDGELAGREAAELKAHLESCAECQAQIDGMRKGAIEVSGLLGMPVHTPDAHAALFSLRKALSDEAVSPGPVTQETVRELSTPAARSQVRVGDRSGSGWSRVARTGVGVMLAAVLVFGLALFWSGLPGRVPVKPPVLGNRASPEVAASEQGAVATLTAEGMGYLTLDMGHPAADFTATDVRTGETVSLSQYRGSVVVLVFWGTWCPPCRDLLTDLKQIATTDTSVQLVNVSMGPRDTKEMVAEFLRGNGYDWPFLHVDVPESIPYGVGSIPATYVIDAQGTIQAAMDGRMGDARLQEVIAKGKARANPTPGTSGDAIADFVPPGKVRHIVITGHNAPGVGGLLARPENVSRDVWFANGDNHLLMHATASRNVGTDVPVDAGIHGLSATPREVWLTDDALYVHVTGTEDVRPAANVVLKYKYNTVYLSKYGPNPDALADLQETYPSARVIESTVLDHRPVIKIVTSNPIWPARTEGLDQSARATMTMTYWIDRETGQHRRVETVTRVPARQGDTMEVFTSTIMIERDELLDADQVEPGYFEFKLPEGATLLEREGALDAFGLEAARSDWFEYVDVPGNFSVLMPRTPDWSYDSSGKTTLGAKRGDVTYGVKYLAGETDLTAPGNAESLNRAFMMATSEGKVLSEQDITLGAYPGKEYRLRDSNGNYRIWRVYAAQQRVYTVFAIAPDETTEADTIRAFFDSFKLLNP